MVDGRRGYRSTETSHSSSLNHVVYRRADQIGEMEELDIGLKIPATLPLTIVDQVLMFMGDVYMGLRPASLAPIT